MLITWLTMGVDYCPWYHVYQFHQKERKMGMLTFHNMIWNAPCIQSVLNCLWGKPLRRIYVRSVMLLNCQNIDNDITRMSLYYWVFSDETKRGNNVSELCALLCLARASNIVSHTITRIVLPYIVMFHRKIHFMPLPCLLVTGNALSVCMKKTFWWKLHDGNVHSWLATCKYIWAVYLH